MSWLEAIILGLVQGLTEFLPVSSSGHLAIGREILGVEASGDLMFEVTVHAATVLATIVVFSKEIWRLLCGLFKFKYNDETDYILKICLSMLPVLVVGVFFKDYVEGLFSSLLVVGFALLVTAALLFFSDRAGRQSSGTSGREHSSCSTEKGPQEPRSSAGTGEGLCGGFFAEQSPCSQTGGEGNGATGGEARNGISWWQALAVGVGQAFAVIPGLSRSGTTISTGLICGVKREAMAQFSFLMVLVPILGEAFLDLVGGDMAASSIGALPLALGFISAFLSGLFACKVMIALVKKARLGWFALYCALAGLTVVIFTLA